ncbi:putative ABC transport system ATP-binding protein [Roseovarius sp. MBR-79]|jgi:putative ABC transport system ATP-binding protein
MSTTVLEIANVRLRTGEAGAAGFVLDLPELRLTQGERVAIVGPSGCGKSMLLEFLALLVKPERVERFVLATSGDVRRDLAEDLKAGRLDALARLRIGPLGYVPQSGGVLPFLTAREHAFAGLRLAGCARNATARARFERLAMTLGLGAHLSKTREQLSGGQRKRVALLAGASVSRRVLLVDEPTTGLDPDACAVAMEMLAALAAEEGTAVLIATHDAEAAHRAGFTVRPLEHGIFRHGPAEGASAFRRPSDAWTASRQPVGKASAGGDLP